MLRFVLKFLPLILHEVADYVKERRRRKQEERQITKNIQENEAK